ncbi:hypothetical protein CLCR_09245 [Cladophialophora carrionii]|uniref:Uncharacterized protein n=1 Tax=Cladophialophora carrionii TaxID=86049 RepID=A0A1C1CUA5_9EURO|nr:hypothetical protein CLCR_09245 [Cladophialophora carrionii]
MRHTYLLQAAEIGDNGLCRGGDPDQGATYAKPLISSAARNQIEAVSWARNPRNSLAETFQYGSCTAGGVTSSHVRLLVLRLIILCAQFHAVRLDPPARHISLASARTAMPVIHTAATATMHSLIKDTGHSTASTAWHSFRAS